MLKKGNPDKAPLGNLLLHEGMYRLRYPPQSARHKSGHEDLTCLYEVQGTFLVISHVLEAAPISKTGELGENVVVVQLATCRN